MKAISQNKLFIGGKWVDGIAPAREVLSPFSGQPVAKVEQADAAQVETAVAAAGAAFDSFKHSSRIARAKLCLAIAAGIEARRKDFVEAMVAEAGKPRALSDAEVTRAVVTFTTAGEEAKRWGGEVIPLDIEPNGKAYLPAVSVWVPRGPLLAITPFNFPLNLVAHKVAPALAVGVPVILKPAPQTPGCATLLAQVFEEAIAAASPEKISPSVLQIIHCSNELVARMVSDPRVQILSFTGSNTVGWMLQGKAIRKRVALELGGDAAVLVHSDADLSRAVTRSVFGAFAYAGQVCISVQRILIQESVAAKFTEMFLAETAKVVSGDPSESGILVGPMIDAKAADRLMSWIDEAVKGGARILLGGKRTGNLISPTVLTQVKPEMKISCEEAFGPVVILDTYQDLSQGLKKVNSSQFGLQAGIFTDSESVIQKTFAELDVGGLIVNDVPTYRQDNMPYGGVKESGLGREGVRYAMEDYSERRTLVSYRL